ncbi:hypothetical protein OJJOAM_000330 [Cupriavidus sp. H18C1]
MPATPAPAAPPEDAVGSTSDDADVLAVSASSVALAHSVSALPSQTRSVPGPENTGCPASMRATMRHASGNSQKVDNPNQPKPISLRHRKNHGQRL